MKAETLYGPVRFSMLDFRHLFPDVLFGMERDNAERLFCGRLKGMSHRIENAERNSKALVTGSASKGMC